VITVYEKLKKGRENRVYRQSNFIDAAPRLDHEFSEAEETVPIVPTFFHIQGESKLHVLDFNKYNKGFRPSKYLYFSEKANLLQADFIENLSPDFSQLLKEKNYWLNIFDVRSTLCKLTLFPITFILFQFLIGFCLYLYLAQ